MMNKPASFQNYTQTHTRNIVMGVKMEEIKETKKLFKNGKLKRKLVNFYDSEFCKIFSSTKSIKLGKISRKTKKEEKIQLKNFHQDSPAKKNSS
jgi:uncharacterized protein YqfB (UPF0267 family)